MQPEISLDIPETRLMVPELIKTRLQRLNLPNDVQVDLPRFQDTLSMVCDAHDPNGYCFLALFMRECDADLLAFDAALPGAAATSKICHKWIGRCAQLGLVGLERRGRQLQAMAKGGVPEEMMREMVELMEEELEMVRVALQYMHIY